MTDVACLKNRIVRAIKKIGQFQRRRSSCCKESTIEVFPICGSPKHFIKDCPIHKIDYQDYHNTGGDKWRNRDQVLVKSRRQLAADHVIKQALAGWGNSFGESNKDKSLGVSILAVEDEKVTFDSSFSLIIDTKDEEKMRWLSLTLRLS